MEEYYAGIGSRSIPQYVYNSLYLIGAFLAKNGLILRSGAALGSDTACEQGCNSVNGKSEIYLPWSNFNGHNSKLILDKTDQQIIDLAKKFHPRFDTLSQGAKALISRNGYQVLGYDLNTPSKFIICYTKDGHTIGGTGQALRMAEYYKIPIFNLGHYKTTEEIFNNFKGFYNYIKNGGTIL